ncbi:MAG: MbnP family copper-binding protein [Polyangiales bacterium]
MRVKGWSRGLGGLCMLLGGCADAGEEVQPVEPPAAQAEAGRTAVTLRFKAKVGEEDFACGRFYAGQGKTGASITPRDFRFFVENVRLLAEDGREVPVQLDERTPYQTPDLALLDFTSGEGRCTSGDEGTNLTITGSVPAGKYRGIAFSNGVPQRLNHADPTLAPAPLQAPGASWNWLLGYRFVMAEALTSEYRPSDAGMAMGGGHGAAEDAGTPAPTTLGASMGDAGMTMATTPGIGTAHLGSTACSGNPALGITCQKPNRTEIRLAGFDPSVHTIVADFGAIFRESDLKAGAECHSGGELCVPIFRAFGVDFTTGKPLPTQSVFRIE